MLSSIRVKGFRRFEDLRVEGLAPVNLFVGTNNAGKTALLEAIELFSRRGDPRALDGPLRRRGEFESRHGDDRRFALAPAGLFRGYRLADGCSFSLAGRDDAGAHTLTCSITSRPPGKLQLSPDGGPSQLELLGGDDPEVAQDDPLEEPEGLDERLWLSWTTDDGGRAVYRLDGQTLARSFRLGPSTEGASGAVGGVAFLGSTPPSQAALAEMWDAVVLTPREKLVLETL